MPATGNVLVQQELIEAISAPVYGVIATGKPTHTTLNRFAAIWALANHLATISIPNLY